MPRYLQISILSYVLEGCVLLFRVNVYQLNPLRVVPASPPRS